MFILNKTLSISFTFATLLLVQSCSDKSSNEPQEQSSGLKKELKTASSDNHEGVWGFCNDKKAAVTTDEESCQTIDASIWHLADGELTALDVTNTETEGCTTACFKLNNEALQTTVVAKGHYEYDETGYRFTITQSSDEKRFPLCTVNWDLVDELADDLVQWKFRNGDCELPEINYSAWARKYVGEVN